MVCVGLFSAPILAQSSLVKKVVLDAGHGGKDPGNLGTGRYKETEKQIALAVTLKVGKYIEENLPDVEVIYTRTDDSFPTLWDRANLANDENADLFISIHCDAFDKESAHGCGSYVMGLDYTDENLRVAQKENSVIFLEDNYAENYDGFDPKSIESIIALLLKSRLHTSRKYDSNGQGNPLEYQHVQLRVQLACSLPRSLSYLSVGARNTFLSG